VQYLFGDYALDPDRRELTRQADAVAIGPKVFDLLLYLIQNRAHVVSKDDVLEAVWSGRIVSESTLTTHINAVRKAIDAEMMSSTTPSVKYSCSGSPLRLRNGNAAMDGLSGSVIT
jgi:DNA-binding winged helix-turn-helix (wHTH) protein